MKNQNRLRLSSLALAVAVAIGTVPAMAQNTTAAIGGRVTAVDGKPAGGAKVTILHIESNTKNEVTADAEGRYAARGLRVGGPYRITVVKDGVTEVQENVFLALAETTAVDMKFGRSTQALEKIVVTGAALGNTFNNTNMGAGTTISRADLNAHFSISRNLQDFARFDPRVAQTDKERGEISVGGQNSRYNSITVDGVSISDTFGLEANNLPFTRQVIPLEAIQSVQVNISNYDATQKGYTGANINAVSRSGTNDFKGSVYGTYTGDRLQGDRFVRATGAYVPPPKSKETLKGVTFGGPIVKDKLFFFVSLEEFLGERAPPAFGPIGSTFNNVAITQSAISGVRSVLNDTYRTDIGTLETPDDATLAFRTRLARLDWNIDADNRLLWRYTNTTQNEPIFPGLFATGVSLSSHWYAQKKTLETQVLQWTSNWSDSFSSEFKASLRDFDSVPKNNSRLPLVTVNFSGALPPGSPAGATTGNRSILFGTERSRHFNALDTRTVDLYGAGTWTKGDHEVKFGGDYSRNKVFNAFLQDVNGNYTFSCVNSNATYTYTFGTINCATATTAQVEQAVLENIRRGRPSSYQAQVPIPGGTINDGVATFTMENYGAMVQDTWQITPSLTLTFGARFDELKNPQKPRANAAAAAAPIAASAATAGRATGGFGLDNTTTFDGENLFQPRFGFNWQLPFERKTQLRGGVGLFQGAVPTVWFSNAFSNTGVSTRVIGCGGAFAPCPVTGGTFSTNPDTQPTFAGASPAANVDFLQNGLGQPSVWKANLSFEHELPWFGMVAGIEYLYTKTNTGIYYQHLNLGAPTRTGIDGRQLFYTDAGYNANCWNATGGVLTTATGCNTVRSRAQNNASFNNVLLATETKKGGGNLATVSLKKDGREFSWGIAYTYTTAKEVSPLTSSVSNSSWASRASFNPNEEVTANSAYLVKDRISGNLRWRKNFFGEYRTEVGMFFESRKGKPYSWTYNNDLNGDQLAGNDLMFIPSGFGSGQVVFVGDTATNRANEERFWQIVNSNRGLSDYAGRVVERNSSFSQWTTNVDMKITQEIPGFGKGHKAAFAFEIQNVGNLLNKKWGRVDEIAFQANGGQARSFVNYAGLDEQGRYRYALANSVQDFTTRQARGESQWALQLAFKYEF
jgi:Carboxypeptidase regulatory-like domain